MASLLAAVEQERALQRRLRAVDIESWYCNAELRTKTFKSEFVDLDVDEARALIAEFKRRRAGHANSSASTLTALERRLDSAIAALGGGVVFAKLSSRSPKDAAAAQSKALVIVQERLVAMRASGQSVTANDVSATIAAATIEAMRCCTGRDIVELLVTSERVCDDDLPLALEFASNWSQKVVVREFCGVTPSEEFRAFVVGGRVTAVSQYYCGACFPDVVASRDAIGERVREFFDRHVRAHTREAQGDEFSLDLWVPRGEDRVVIIELNPFGKPDGLGTGLAAFSKRDAHDLAVVFGEAPFEMRVVASAPYASMADLGLQGPLADWMRANAFL